MEPPGENTGMPTVRYALPAAISDPRDQADIQWVLNYGKKFGATELLRSPVPSTDAPFDHEVVLDAARPGHYDVVMSYGRQCVVCFEALALAIRRRIGDSLDGEGRAMGEAIHPVTARREYHIRLLSRAVVPLAMPDGPPLKRLREHA